MSDLCPAAEGDPVMPLHQTDSLADGFSASSLSNVDAGLVGNNPLIGFPPRSKGRGVERALLGLRFVYHGVVLGGLGGSESGQ
jgi:hypothetical protein